MKFLTRTFCIASLLIVPALAFSQETPANQPENITQPAQPATAEPLYLIKYDVDAFVAFDFNKMEALNPSWIKGIEVLQNTEEAVEVFGEQASSGVIIFELKEEHLSEFIAMLPKEGE